MRYHQLFSVNYQHEYYKSKKFKGFGVELSTQTERLMKSYGMVFRVLDDGFTVLFKEENEGGSLLRKLKETLRFSFFLISRDKIFLNYSDILGGLQNQGYWMTNLKANDDASLIHTGAHLSEQDKIQFISSVGDMADQLPDDASVKVEDIFGEILFEGSKDELKQQTALTEEGYLKVTASEDIKEYYSKPRRSNQVIGVVDIVVKPVGDTEYGFEKILDAEYKIAIDTKATTWRYNLINRDDYQYSDFKVYAGKDVVPTTDAEEKIMLNGEKAYAIETASPIRLQERYDNNLELEMIKKETDRNIKKRISLPVPDINKVKVARVNDVHQAYSEMYIYF